MKLKPGDTVRVVGSRRTAKIYVILASVHGALLDRQIEGFRNWNLNELRLVERGKQKQSLKNLPGRLTCEDIVDCASRR